MASMWPPKKNTAFTLSFTLYKNDGTIVANPGTYTKKVSIDGAAVADIAASVTEEDTTYGQLSLVLSADEMNGDWIWVYVTDNTAGTVPFTCTLYTVANTLAELGTSIASILADTGTDGVVVASIANNAITAAAIATGAIDADAIADGAIDAGSIAADAITAAAIATDAIDADALKADAVTEIQSGLMTAAGYTAPPTVGQIADQVWDEAIAGHAGAGSTGAALSAATAPSAATVADAVWDEALAGHVGAGSTGEALNAAGAAGDPWTTAIPGAYGAGSAGKIVGDSLATMVPQTGDAFARLGAPVGASISADVADVEGKVDDLEGRLTAGRATALDYLDAAVSTRLASAGYTVPPTVVAIRQEMDASSTKLANLDGTITSRASQASLDTLDDYVDTEIAAIKAKTDNLPASPAAVGSAMTLDLTQAVPTDAAALTVGRALIAAIGQGFGRWTLVGTTLTVMDEAGATLRTFTLDDATDPTSRT